MVTKAYFENKKKEFETEYDNLIQLSKQKGEQYENDCQNIRDRQNILRGFYQAYTEIAELIEKEERETAQSVSADVEEVEEVEDDKNKKK